ncbi:MAG: hypothetical protein K0S80_773 [Neobacillus sp.]|nr:hypothetical protein [Neobacillus sp.]
MGKIYLRNVFKRYGLVSADKHDDGSGRLNTKRKCPSFGIKINRKHTEET